MFEIAFVLLVCAAFWAGWWLRGRLPVSIKVWPGRPAWQDPELYARYGLPSSNRCTRCGRNYDPARNWRMDCVTGTCQPSTIAAGSSLPERPNDKCA